MVEIARIKDGVMAYATKHMMPMLDSKGQFLLGMGIGLAERKMDKAVAALANNELVKALDIIQDGQVDYDTLFGAAMAQMQRQGKLTWDIPLIGRIKFDQQDLRDLHQCIMQGGNAA